MSGDTLSGVSALPGQSLSISSCWTPVTGFVGVRGAGPISAAADVVAVCVRLTLMRARREPVWGQLLNREGFSVHALNWGLGQRLLCDSQSGISAKRFVVSGHFLCLISVTGIIFAAIAAELHSSTRVTPAVERQNAVGMDEQNFAERAATFVQ